MRTTILALLLAAIGCTTTRTAYYAAPPACGSCGTPPVDSRYLPVPTAPPPLARTDDPLIGDERGRMPIVRLLPPRAKVETKAPPLAVPKPDEPPQPIDLPGFAEVKAGVSNGLKPFPEGIDWLKARGYKTALHLRPPGDAGAADKRLFEKRGLEYIGLEVSALTLDEEKLKEFSRIVSDEKSHPLFVYDRDGAVAGGMWYLHARVTLGESDEKAKAEATRLGLRIDDSDGDHKTMWLAVQNLASKLKP